MDFSYTIPYFDITINQASAIQYAKTHVGSIGPALAVLVLVLGFVIMLVIFVYLSLCSCICCDKKSRPIPDRSVNMHMSGTTTLGISRSEAPLRSGLRSNDVEAGYLTTPKSRLDSPGPLAGSLLNRQIEGRRLEDSQKQERAYSWRCFNVTSALMCLLFALCTGAVLIYQNRMDVGVKDTAGSGETLLLNAANFLCDDQEGSTTCSENSLGSFIKTAQSNIRSTLGGIVLWLDSVGGILPPVNMTIDALNSTKAQLSSIEIYAGQINSNITDISDHMASIRKIAQNPRAASLASSLPSGNISSISLQPLQQALTALDSAIADGRGIYSNVKSALDNDIAPVRAQLDNVTGTTTLQLLKPLNKIFNYIQKAQNETLHYHDVMAANVDHYTPYIKYKSLAVAGLFLLPLLILIFCLLANHNKPKCSGHLVTGMICQFILLFLLCLAALIFSLFSTVTNTICEYHDQALDHLPTRNFTISNTSISIGPTTAKEILQCPGGDYTTPDNNFIDILGAGSLFNVTAQTSQATNQIRTAVAGFNPNVEIQKAMGQLNNMTSATSFNFSSNASLTSYNNKLLNLTQSLPSRNVDKTSSDQQARLTKYYGFTGNFWKYYQANVSTISTILTTGQNIPPQYRHIYSMNNISLFNTSVYRAHATEFAGATCGSTIGDCNTVLLPHVQVTDRYTNASNSAVQINDQILDNLNEIMPHIGNVQNSMADIASVQGAVAGAKDNINGTLQDLLAVANNVIGGVAGQEARVGQLANFVSTGPDYTKCGFVGDFYAQGFEQQICGTVRHSLANTWPYMLAGAVGLIVSFITLSCHVRKPSKYGTPIEDMASTRLGMTSTPLRPAMVM